MVFACKDLHSNDFRIVYKGWQSFRKCLYMAYMFWSNLSFIFTAYSIFDLHYK